LLPVASLLAGTVLGGVLEALRDRRTVRRERIARMEARADADHVRTVEFQRTTLIALQIECTKLIRQIGQMHHFDAMSARDKGWGKTMHPEGLSDGVLATLQQVGMLRVRVEDEAIRAISLHLTEISTKVGMARSEEEGNSAIAPLTTLVPDLNEKIGSVLRRT